MIELGGLERHRDDLSRRNTRVIAISVEDLEDAQKTQAAFPHLVVLADYDRGLSKAVDLIHPRSGPGGGDTSAPTTILVDRHGVVRWLYRPRQVSTRLSPDEVVAAVDAHIPPQEP
jgi:peroxiredoxin